MNKIVAKAIVLRRTDFKEADRIVTVITPTHGKVGIIAKGSRKLKSKLAGGIELFGVSDITFLDGRGELKTLISARLVNNFSRIVKDIDRTMLGYKTLKIIDKVSEDAAGREYFDLLLATLECLNNMELSNDCVELWFNMRVLHISGHEPNLRSDNHNKPFQETTDYEFDQQNMAFAVRPGGAYSPSHIKLLQLCVKSPNSGILQKIQGLENLLPNSLEFSRAMLSRFVRI